MKVIADFQVLSNSFQDSLCFTVLSLRLASKNHKYTRIILLVTQTASIQKDKTPKRQNKFYENRRISLKTLIRIVSFIKFVSS